jgi:hypothetical protein
MPVEQSDNTGTARMFEWFLLEQKPRVPQPPRMRKTSGGLKGKSNLSEQIARGIKLTNQGRTHCCIKIFA